MTTEHKTPLTDAESVRFGRLMITYGTPDNPKFETMQIVPADFARKLERDRARLVEIGKQLRSAATDQERYAAQVEMTAILREMGEP